MNTVLYILISLIVIIFLTFLYIQYLERESDKKRFNDRLNIDEKWRNKWNIYAKAQSVIPTTRSPEFVEQKAIKFYELAMQDMR